MNSSTMEPYTNDWLIAVTCKACAVLCFVVHVFTWTRWRKNKIHVDYVPSKIFMYTIWFVIRSLSKIPHLEPNMFTFVVATAFDAFLVFVFIEFLLYTIDQSMDNGKK